MLDRKFNLIDGAWIKVLDKNGQEQLVSLKVFFDQIENWQDLAGDMKSQDLVIFRFVLAILETVYTRFDINGHVYSFLQLNDQMELDFNNNDELEELYRMHQDELLKTWEQLYKQGHFSSVVISYLNKHYDQFSFFNEQTSSFIYSLNDANEYLAKKQWAWDKNTGNFPIKTLNKNILESNNSKNVLSEIGSYEKGQLSTDELVRWLLTYQQFAGVTEKTSVKDLSDPNQKNKLRGWLYSIKPVIAQGSDLFETLMLNLIFEMNNVQSYTQRPIWEFNKFDYLQRRQMGITPNNFAELYVVPSRIIAINEINGKLVVKTAKLPGFGMIDMPIEPMATWRLSSEKNGSHLFPDFFSYGDNEETIWQNFGRYFGLTDRAPREPSIVTWLKKLAFNGRVDRIKRLSLTMIGLVPDSQASSQIPVFELVNSMTFDFNAFFVDDPEAVNYWPKRVNDMVKLTNAIGDRYRFFLKDVMLLRGFKKSSQQNDLVRPYLTRYYQGLNQVFSNWLMGLTSHDNRNEKCKLWKDNLAHYIYQQSKFVLNTCGNREIAGDPHAKDTQNLFTFYRQFRYSCNKLLKSE